MRRSYRRGPDKVCVISVGDRVHAGVYCLDGLQRALSHQGEKSTAERVTLSGTTSRCDVNGAGWVVSEELHCGVSAIDRKVAGWGRSRPLLQKGCSAGCVERIFPVEGDDKGRSRGPR